MLRTRLFLNLAPFVVLLLAVGLYAIALFSRLGHRVDATVAGNYRNLLTAQAMRLELAGMEREVWSSSTTTNGTSPIFALHQEHFETNLVSLSKPSPSALERELYERLTTNYHAFNAAVAEFNTAPGPESRRNAYQRGIVPSALGADIALERIRDLHDQAIRATPDAIQKITREITWLMIIGLAVTLLVTAYICLQLGRSILSPIQTLTLATRELGEGKTHPPIPVVTRDELGELAQAFNKLTAQLDEYRQSTTAEIVRLHRTMETTLASFPDPIFVLDRNGRIQLQNPSAQTLAVGLQIGNQLPEKLHIIAQATLAAGRDFLPHSFDAVVCYRVGEADKFFLPRVLAMNDKQGVPLGVAVVLYDVTRFRLLDAAKSNLVATVSHELKTPLTSVRMALHILAEKNFGALTPKQDELVMTAREDSERLLHILNDLLDLARLDEGRAELRREEVAPLELMHGVKQELNDAITAKRLRVSCVAAPDLPPVSVDRQRIRHVFRNLIHNAIKHSPEGGELQLRANSANGEGVQFTVTDQGPGVPEEFQARIFDRFFRVPGQSKTGAGLGLSIAREITVAHGGRIGVKSQPGHGSTFYVILKAADSPA